MTRLEKDELRFKLAGGFDQRVWLLVDRETTPDGCWPWRGSAPVIDGTEPDHRGRYLQEIQQWPEDQLEAVHDYPNASLHSSASTSFVMGRDEQPGMVGCCPSRSQYTYTIFKRYADLVGIPL